MSWTVLQDEIYDLINDNSDALNIQQVSKWPKLTFTGYPAVTVTPANNASKFEDTKDNERIYSFDVRVFYETKSSKISGALTGLLQVVDDVIDKFDQENDAATRTIGVNMPAKYTFINLLAVLGDWFNVEDGNVIFHEFKVMVKVSVDIT